MPDYAKECHGFLTLTGQEQLFALDGQHRLAGIKKALAEGTRLGEEQLTVIIVVHRPTPEGVKRSRRLFTTLNKKAQFVTKDAIIALDEDDISASITRRLVEESGLFNEDNVSFSVGPLRDNKSVTTIGNIYDCTQRLVANFLGCSVSKIEKTIIAEPEKVWEHVYEYYRFTFEHVTVLSQLVSQGNSVEYIKKCRNSQTGGHLLFRPIGWEIYTDAVISLLRSGTSLKDAIAVVTKKDLTLSGPIFAGRVWSLESKRIMDAASKAWGEMINDLTA
jgi:DNA sulfur modification protein DndB